MPNHVRNYLTVVGSAKDIDLFVAKARGSMPSTGDEQPNNNKAFNPNADIGKGRERPEEVLCFHSLLPLPKAYSENPYGNGSADSGYSLEIATWGVKWGAYDQAEPVLQPGLVTYKFTTAWASPTEFIAKVAIKFPSLRFFMSWGGEGPTRGRAFFHGKRVVIKADVYKESDYPDWRAFAEDDEAYHEAYKAVECARLHEHYPWVSHASAVRRNREPS